MSEAGAIYQSGLVSQAMPFFEYSASQGGAIVTRFHAMTLGEGAINTEPALNNRKAAKCHGKCKMATVIIPVVSLSQAHRHCFPQQ